LILRKIIKIVATRCHILQLKCTKFDFCWGSASDRAGERFRPIAEFKGRTSGKDQETVAVLEGARG